MNPRNDPGAAVTGSLVPVTAEWALHGKMPDDRRYRLLDWSDAVLGRQNFEEALSRYSPGTLDKLPQAMLSFLPTQQPDLHYVAVAIHSWPEDEKHDAYGREIEFTSFFCVPYSQLSASAASYQAMYEAFRPIRLPTPSRVPIQATLTVTPPRMPPSGDLALRVAALLLTGRPVCVLDADQISLEERLGFIDSVMSLLPYGMRSRMSAATWTSSTYRQHKFRLFFSSAPRATDQKDHVVFWGRPELADIPDDPTYARDYLVWLEQLAQQPALRLADQTDEMGFAVKEVLQMLERNGVYSQADEDEDLAAETAATFTSPVPSVSSRPAAGAALITESLSSRISREDREGLRSDIASLENYLLRNKSVPAEERETYRSVITTRGLLAPRPDVLGELAAAFYDVLLRLAFGTPLTYEAYCQVEDVLGHPRGEPPHRALLEAISSSGPQDARVQAIVLWALGGTSLSRWFRSGELDIIELVGTLAGDWPRPDHATVVCEVALRYLSEMRDHYSRRSVADALHERGYLAPALQRRYQDRVQYQAETLDGFLRVAYPGGLSRTAVSRILTGTGSPPTVALLVAVLLRVSDPADAAAAREDYLRGMLDSADLNAETRTALDMPTRRKPAPDTSTLEPRSPDRTLRRFGDRRFPRP